MLNMATWPAAKRLAVQADLLACRIRWECRALGERERQQMARELLAKVPSPMREAVVERMRARSST